MLLAGIVGKPHGITGEVYVRRISDDPARFEPGATLTHEDGRTLVVASARAHRDRFLVRFEGIVDRTGAEGLRGELLVEESARRSLGEDEYWVSDLEGCEVRLASGGRVGTVSEVVPGPAQDLLAVDLGSGEALIPLVPQIVTGVDVAGKVVTIDPPEGLLP